LASRSKIAAVVLAAGRSKRFASSRSKLVHPFGGRPLIEWPLAALRKVGAEPLVVVVGPQAADLRSACGDGVAFAVQRQPRGTGHAVLTARSALRGFRGDVIILNGDLPFLRPQSLGRLVQCHRNRRAGLTLLTASVGDPGGWGRIRRGRGGVEAIVEDRDASPSESEIHEVNVGLYCVEAKLLFSLLGKVKPDNAQGEIYLTDIVAGALRRGVVVADLRVAADEVGQINNRQELAAMEKQLREKINAKWMARGVTLEDPDTAYIGPDVRIGRDTVIGPNVHLRGRTRIGSDCRIDGSSFLTDSVIGAAVHLRFGVVMTEVKVGRGCQIGPFAHLRPGSQLSAEVHIGDFVETKNATIGARTKANHLAYIGDAEIGRDTNIGAGTITCNYDGFHKYTTVIGDRVQVGSDTQLVAPVRLADDVYVASGSTVRNDVGRGALVFNPREQQERRGWVAARRQREAASASGARSGTRKTSKKR
jgi:bifunctional UDP-N-acetylglucosamine pyrophosphorylase/glucosamine-1-phosphate N-acetyltransferase